MRVTDDFGHSPIFQPPNAPDVPDDEKPFQCDYTAMNVDGAQWGDCSTSGNRGCWIRNYNGSGEEYNIFTNYETKTPKGILREVSVLLLKSVRAGGWAHV